MQKVRHAAVLHPAAAPCDLDQGGGSAGRGSSSRQQMQAAAAWAWFQQGGAASSSSRTSEGHLLLHRPVAHASPSKPSSSFRRPSRFKKEFMATACDVDQPSCLPAERYRTAPPADANWLPSRRRHSFHGADTAAAPTSILWSNTNSGEEDELDGDDDIQSGSSTLLDKFELESLWRQVRPHVDMPGPARPVAVRAAKSSCATTHAAGHMAATAAMADGKELHRPAVDDGSSHSGGQRFGSKSKDNHHHHVSRRAPEFLHHLLHLRILNKPARSPAFCSSIATANSITDHHLPHQLSMNKAGSPMHRYQDVIMSGSRRWPQYAAAAHESGGLVHPRRSAADGSQVGQELLRLSEYHDDHHHNHRHIHHHHHHHHHHLLPHQGDAMLLKHVILSKDAGSNSKLQSLQREIPGGHKHYYFGDQRINNARARPVDKYLHPPHSSDYSWEPSLFRKSPASSHSRTQNGTQVLCDNDNYPRGLA